MGKPGFIAQKISATLSSTGTPSLFLHPAEALHGDLGRVLKSDIVIAFSNSGQTEEIIKLFYITYNPDSSQSQEFTTSKEYLSPLVQAAIDPSAV